MYLTLIESNYVYRIVYAFLGTRPIRNNNKKSLINLISRLLSGYLSHFLLDISLNHKAEFYKTSFEQLDNKLNT